MNALEMSIWGTINATSAVTTLLAGTTSIYNLIVPRNQFFPAIVFGFFGGGDANETPRRRKDVLYTVKAITATSMQAAGAIDAQVDAILHNKTLVVSGWTNYWMARERDIAYHETTPEGREYWHCGGIYRIRLNPS